MDKEDLVGQMLIQPRAEPEADYLYTYGPLRATVHLARRFGDHLVYVLRNVSTPRDSRRLIVGQSSACAGISSHRAKQLSSSSLVYQRTLSLYLVCRTVAVPGVAKCRVDSEKRIAVGPEPTNVYPPVAH